MKRTISFFLLMFYSSIVLANIQTMHMAVVGVGGAAESTFNYSDDFSTNTFVSGEWTSMGASHSYTIIPDKLRSRGGSQVDRKMYLINEGKDFIDGEIEVDSYSWTTYEAYGLIFRAVDYNNYYWFRIDGSSPNCELVKVVDGVDTLLGSGASGYSKYTDYNLRVELDGSSISVYRNDTLIDSVTDSTHEKGAVGLMVTRAAGGAVFDNFDMSMTYEEITNGLVGSNSGTLTYLKAGFNRGFGSRYAYTATRSGLVSKIYYEQDDSLDKTLINVAIGAGTINSSYMQILGYSSEYGTQHSGDVYVFDLVRPFFVLKGAEYSMHTACNQSTWDLYGIEATGEDIGNDYSENTTFTFPADHWHTANLVSDYKLKMWAE